MTSIGKSRHEATSDHQPVNRSAAPVQLGLSGSEDDPDKENQCIRGNQYRNNYLIESSDDDFDKCEFILLLFKFCPAVWLNANILIS